MKQKKKVLMLFVSLFAAILISGCRTGVADFHVSQDFDFSFIKRAAVLPFDNLTNEKTAGEAVRQIVINQLLVSGLVDVALPGDVSTAFDKARVASPTALTADQLKKIGADLKVQAMIFGTVNRFGEIRSGQFQAPEVSVTLMMADANTGLIIWSVTRSNVGDSFLARHFGARSDTLSETLQKTVRQAINTLAK